MANQWNLVGLDASIETDHFSCGEKFFDDFLKRYALTNQKSGLCEVHVATEPAKEKHALGYFTLSASSIERTILPAPTTHGLPKYEHYPTILIGILARDSSQKGSDLGNFLIASALQYAKAINVMGFVGVELLAANDKLVAWYTNFGFMTLQKRANKRTMMFIHKDAIP